MIALLPDRSKEAPFLGIQAAGFFSSAFVTRLAFEHHKSRYQIAGFICFAALFEAMRAGRRPGEPSLQFWAVAAVGAALGVVLARPISHRFWFGPW